MQEIKALQQRMLSVTEGAEKLSLLLLLSSKMLYVHLDNCVAYAKEAETLAIKLDDNNSLAEANRLIGLSHYFRGESMLALGFLNKAEQLYSDNGNVMGAANSLNGLGVVYIAQTLLDDAIGVFEKALAIYRKEKSDADIAKVLTNLSIPHKTKGEYEKSILYLDECLAIYESINDEMATINAKANKAGVYFSLDRYQDALNIFLECMAFFEAGHHKLFYANTLMNVANCYNRLKNYPVCLQYEHQALKAYTSLGLKENIADIYNDMGNVLGAMGGYAEAEKYLKKALKILGEEGNDGERTSIVNHSLGSNYLMAKDFENAEKYLLKGLEIAIAKQVGRVVPVAYKLLAELYTTIGENEKAEKYGVLLHSEQLVG